MSNLVTLNTSLVGQSSGCGTDVPPLNVSEAVRSRYSEASQTQVPELCCPVSYDPRFLKVIPQEVLDRDYGCGDPSKYVREGDVVLDLGSGGGKICFIASQVVGPRGRVIGVDCNDDMLALARSSKAEVARRIGFDNIEFRKGQIQDLKLDLDQLDEVLRAAPVSTSSGWLRAHETAENLRRTLPMIPDATIDVVVSNCVLNLVRSEDRRQLFSEIYRVLKTSGRAVISDIVSDCDVPASLQNNAELWSGCISGAFREDMFATAFEDAGFQGLEILERQSSPWRVVEGIAFRSVTIRAYKLSGSTSECCGDSHASVNEVIYRGPWASVQDDAGQSYPRGKRVSVSSESVTRFTEQPYAGHMLIVGEATASSLSLIQPGGTECCGPKGCC